MINREQKQLDKFKTLITKDWKLSLAEEDFLDTILNLLLAQDSKKTSDVLENYLSEEWEEVLESIPNYYIKEYSLDYLDMIEESDCDEEKSLEDFDDDEIKEEYFDRFDVIHSNDIVTDMHFDEMSELFLSFSPQKQQNIINIMKNGII